MCFYMNIYAININVAIDTSDISERGEARPDRVRARVN